MLLSIANLYRLHFVGTNTIQISIIINYLAEGWNKEACCRNCRLKGLVAEVAVSSWVICGASCAARTKKWSKYMISDMLTMAISLLSFLLFVSTTNNLHPTHQSNSSLSISLTMAKSNDDWETVPAQRRGKKRQNDIIDLSSPEKKQGSMGRTASSPFVLILVGLPGSGKSFFATRLEKADPRFGK